MGTSTRAQGRLQGVADGHGNVARGVDGAPRDAVTFEPLQHSARAVVGPCASSSLSASSGRPTSSAMRLPRAFTSMQVPPISFRSPVDVDSHGQSSTAAFALPP